MQRDLGNEVIVALVAVGILAFAVTFAIILSLSTVTPPETTPTAAAVEATDTFLPTLPFPATITDTPRPSTVVTTTRPAAVTAVTADNTPTDRSTEEPQVTPTSTRPAQTPTQTVTPSPTRTPSPTNTPTATLTPTATFTPSSTPTRTPRPTETSGIRPTPTGTPTPVITAVTAAAACHPPAGWLSYTVRAGETLNRIAQATGSTTQSLKTANCLTDANTIFSGQTIFVPRRPAFVSLPVITAPPVPSPKVTPALAAEGCTAPSTQITSPRPGQTFSGAFAVEGTAAAEGFQYYKIEVRPHTNTEFNFLRDSKTPVVGGVLGEIDPSIFTPGVHWIKLTVISAEHQTPCVIPVIFQ